MIRQTDSTHVIECDFCEHVFVGPAGATNAAVRAIARRREGWGESRDMKRHACPDCYADLAERAQAEREAERHAAAMAH